MRVEDCSKDGRTCPECNYVSHTTSDLMYHVARVHDFVLDYLPPHVKEKVVGLESRNKIGGGSGGGSGPAEGGNKTKIVGVSHIIVIHIDIFFVRHQSYFRENNTSISMSTAIWIRLS